MVDFRYLEQAKQQAPHVQIMQYGQPLSASLRRVFIDLNLKTVSFEQDYITWEQYEIWENKLGDLVEFLPLPDLTLKLRMLKGPEEIALIRKAAQIADQAFLEVLPLLRSGISERDFAIELEYAMRRGRAQGMAFETIVASGPRAALPHGIASERIIQPGELVIIDFGAIYQGYCSDCTRTVCVGAATPKQQEIYALVEKAQDTALKALCPGITAAELDALARQVISEKGYGENFGHSLGHGVGRLVHEEPTLGSKDQTVIEAGMVVTIEPGIYLPGWGGVRLEELVLVTDIGYEILTRCAKGLTLAAD